jgi:hypothetical protein
MAISRWQQEKVLEAAQTVLKERGYTDFKIDTPKTEYSPLSILIASAPDGRKAEAYPRNTRTGVTYKIYED